MLSGINHWQPGTGPQGSDRYSSERVLAKAGGFTLPVLNFETVYSDINHKFEELRNPNYVPLKKTGDGSMGGVDMYAEPEATQGYRTTNDYSKMSQRFSRLESKYI